MQNLPDENDDEFEVENSATNINITSTDFEYLDEEVDEEEGKDGVVSDRDD